MAKSLFDLTEQNSKIEGRIVVALERLSEAFRVLLWEESKETSLSPIQIQLLIFLQFHSAEKCKVSYLADEFNLTKATISDSVKILLQKGLIEKAVDKSDTRSFSISLTREGKRIAVKSSQFAGAIEKPLHQFSAKQKEILLLSLLELIERLNKDGIITIQRMCFTCRFHKKTGSVHYCNLLKKNLKNGDLRVDCPEHELAVIEE